MASDLHLSDLHLGPQARERLACGLDALDAHIEAPLRVRGHASGRGHDVFDLQEEFELGPDGRRFILSVRLGGRDTLLLPFPGRLEAR